MKLHFTLFLAGSLVLGAANASAAKTATPSKADQVKKALVVLKSNAPEKEEADACRELARIGGSEAVAPLAALLPDEKLSHMARYGLETIPSSAVDKAFRAALPKLHGPQLVGVIGSIGVRGDPKAVSALTKLLTDSDPDVAQAAARSLGRIGNLAAAKFLRAALPNARPENRLALAEGMLRCAERLNASGNSKEAIAIYDQLRSQEAHQVQAAALRGAVLLRGSQGLPLLMEAICSSEYPKFAAATRVAMEVPDPQLTRLLAMELPKLSADRQIVLCEVLARRGNLEGLPVLLAAAKMGSKPVRLAAIRAAAEFNDPRVVPAFVQLLDDDDAELARAAQDGLAGSPLKEADAAALKLLSASEPDRRVKGLELIARRRMVSAVPEVFRAAESSDSKVSSVAAAKLGELASTSELPRLITLVAGAKSSADLDAKAGALEAVSLRSTDKSASAEQLAARLPQAPAPEKCALLRILASLTTPNALTAVRSAVGDADPSVRTAAIRALGSWSGDATAPDLLTLAKTAANPNDRMLCLRSYLSLADQADLSTEKRLAMCREAAALVQRPEEKKLLLGTLGGIHSVEAIATLERYLDDAAVRDEAVTASANIADKLLAGRNAKPNPELAKHLEKVSQVETTPELKRRIADLLKRAQPKTGDT